MNSVPYHRFILIFRFKSIKQNAPDLEFTHVQNNQPKICFRFFQTPSFLLWRKQTCPSWRGGPQASCSVSAEGREDGWEPSWVSSRHKLKKRLASWDGIWGKGQLGDHQSPAGLLCFSLFEANWSVWWPTNRVTVLVANWTLYFHSEFKAHLTGRCIKYSQVWHRTNWMQFTLPLKFMPFFVKRPQVLTTSLRGWNGREEIESNYKSSLRLLLSSQLPTIASWKWRNPQLLRKDPLFLFIHLS